MNQRKNLMFKIQSLFVHKVLVVKWCVQIEQIQTKLVLLKCGELLLASGNPKIDNTDCQ